MEFEYFPVSSPTASGGHIELAEYGDFEIIEILIFWHCNFELIGIVNLNFEIF